MVERRAVRNLDPLVLARARYTSWSGGENLNWRSADATARQVVGAWMKSAGHRANILQRSWTAIGIGAVKATNPTGVYRGVSSAAVVAAEFGRRG